MLLFVDHLINIDFSYLDSTRGIVGETWIANVELAGELDDQGMVCDFGIVKKIIRDWLNTEIDHRLLIPQHSPALLERSQNGLSWQYSAGGVELQSPQQALTFVPCEAITAKSVSNWCVSQLMPLFPKSVNALTLHFGLENIDTPFYHYSHGLKKHKGNCQRIAHGHRSKIEIWIDDELALNDMNEWATRWQDIYIGSTEDLVKQDEHNFYFAYHAQQGAFSLSLPRASTYLLPTDSTVEFIANHIANELAKKHPAKHIRVKAYEGQGKGAIATKP